MPSTLLGLIILLAAIGPGYCFIVARGRRVPDRGLSELRELVELALVGSLCTVVAALAVTAVAARQVDWPDTDDLSTIIAQPMVYLLESPARLTGALVGAVLVLLIACAVAYLLAVLIHWDSRPSIDPRGSAWRTIFSEEYRGHDKETTVLLDGGAQLVGYAHGFTVGPDEEQQRELLLARPFVYKPDGDAPPYKLDVDRLVVRSDQIRLLTVKYVRRQGPAEHHEQPTTSEPTGR